MKRTPYFIFWAAITFVIVASLCACGAPKVVTVTEYRDRIVHDTCERVRVDSVRVSHYVREKGDTVQITDTVIMWRASHDAQTHTEYVHDSIPYPVEVQVPVRTRNGYDRFTSCCFWLLLLLLIIRIAWWAVKKYYLRR